MIHLSLIFIIWSELQWNPIHIMLIFFMEYCWPIFMSVIDICFRIEVAWRYFDPSFSFKLHTLYQKHKWLLLIIYIKDFQLLSLYISSFDNLCCWFSTACVLFTVYISVDILRCWFLTAYYFQFTFLLLKIYVADFQLLSLYNLHFYFWQFTLLIFNCLIPASVCHHVADKILSLCKERYMFRWSYIRC